MGRHKLHSACSICLRPQCHHKRMCALSMRVAGNVHTVIVGACGVHVLLSGRPGVCGRLGMRGGSAFVHWRRCFIPAVCLFASLMGSG